ncbi:MAG: methionine--tRNA ligase [Candidatus Blackburnbacteria bacterium]|nr:methionine--tRNA ligase [Candidatus Blackburnbacteria bacterium]
MAKYFVTTPIYYVNDVPHIGHAYTTVAADALARYWREKVGKENVFFLTGTDEHGAKVAQAAKEAGKTPKEFADSVVPRFQEAWKLLNIEYDYFIRTTDPKHERVVREILQKIYDKGYIYEGVYEGLYCEGCEKFLTKDELVDGKCPLHPNKEPVYQKEKNYFFRLSAFKDKLLGIFNGNGYQILPEPRKNEILGKLQGELQDVSISRAGVSWGIPIPWDKKQTIYVWVDALFNYYSTVRFLKNKSAFWPPDLHLVGKDILWFHAVIWAALLLAADLKLPKKVFAHGFFTIGGQKMSKSLGNVISPQQLVERYGKDAARYLLLSEFPFGEDGDFSFEKLDTRYNADLANGLGNVVARVAKLCQESDFLFAREGEFAISGPVEERLEGFRFHDALGVVRAIIDGSNKSLDEDEPWKLSGERLKQSLAKQVRRIRQIACELQPFLPETAGKIEKQFAGPKIKSDKPLFPRLT